jgi:hypothetical protein
VRVRCPQEKLLLAGDALDQSSARLAWEEGVEEFQHLQVQADGSTQLSRFSRRQKVSSWQENQSMLACRIPALL